MFKSVLWDFSSKILNQLISLVVSVILARLLTPEDFGIVGIALVFVSFSTLFLDLGFRNTIVFDQERSSDLYSTVVIFNVAGALLLAGLIYFSASWIAIFFKEPQIKNVVQWVTILFVLNAATLVPNALNSKELRFKALAGISVTSSVISGVIAIYAAIRGYGLWSILIRAIVNSLLVCALNWLICSWKFKWKFKATAIKKVWSHSFRFFLTSLMEGVFVRLDVLIIGKAFNPSIVGYYTRAQSLDNISRELTSGTMYSVFFPYFSKIQDDRVKVIEVYKQCLHMVSFIVLAISGFFFINAKAIFIILFTEKWLPSVDIFRILTLIGFVYTLTVVMNILLGGIGKTKEFLEVETRKKAMLVLAYLTAFIGNIYIFLYALVVAYVIGFFLNLVYVAKILKLTIAEQLNIVFRYFIISLFLVICILFLAELLWKNVYLHLITTGVVYLCLFHVVNLLVNNPAAHMLVNKYKEYKAVVLFRMSDRSGKSQ